MAIVCDGAGSARLSEQGAQFVAAQTVQALAGRLEQGASVQDLHDGALAGTLAQIRAALDDIARAANATLDDYASTVVGVVMGQDAGFFFHLGDGLGVAQLADGSELISLPANGEYASETYFLSGERWREQLRLLPIPTVRARRGADVGRLHALCHEQEQCSLVRPSWMPCKAICARSSVELGNAALASTLADPRTHQITGDDKTLLLALRA